ncbi:hypothetical protein [Novosphingobium barchaimii]|uniref:hypothetical protein n=1 Tax=Novosphingobium barchaimii TaxID=1420591 RepID=UPI0011DFF044|nr:hypothetical protein [Novosphingobium barchaimii]
MPAWSQQDTGHQWRHFTLSGAQAKEKPATRAGFESFGRGCLKGELLLADAAVRHKCAFCTWEFVFYNTKTQPRFQAAESR